MSHTIFADVSKTMEIDCRRFMIPMSNEMFREDYTGEEEVVLSNEEHYLKGREVIGEKRISDSHFMIRRAGIVKRYHIECQTRPDSSILKRMADYDSRIAIENSEIGEDKLTVELPSAGVLYLQSTKNTPDTLEILVKTSSGYAIHKVHVMKLNNYSVNDIFEKQLYYLIPFHILVYKNKLMVYNKAERKLFQLQKIYEDIRDRLLWLGREGILNEYELGTVFDLTREVLEYVTEKYERVKERLGAVMTGRVLEYPTKTRFREAIQQGLAEGRAEGRAEGERNAYLSLLKDGVITIVEAAKRLNMTEEELKASM